MGKSCRNCTTMQECKDSMKHQHTCGNFNLVGVMPKKPKKSKDLCIGCRNNWYNSNKEGGCWSYKTGIVVLKDKIAHLMQRPPYPLEYRLDCFIREW